MNCPIDCKQEQKRLGVKCLELPQAVKVNNHIAVNCCFQWGSEVYVKYRLYPKAFLDDNSVKAVCERNTKVGGENEANRGSD